MNERERLAKIYRALEGKELLSLYQNPDQLSPLAVEALRDELKVRGIDPDSLKATVPKAAAEEEKDGPPEGSGPAGGDLDVPEELAGAFDPSAPMVECPSCGAPNRTDEARCRACLRPLRETPEPPQASAGPEPGTLASATFGLLGFAALAFSGFVARAERAVGSLVIVAAAVGAASLAAAVVLYRRSTRR